MYAEDLTIKAGEPFDLETDYRGFQKNDEKVEKFGKAIRTAGNQLIELGENWLEEDEMNAYQLKKVEEMVKQAKKMLAKL